MERDLFLVRIWKSVRKWLKRHENALVILVGLLAVGTLTFEAGLIQGVSRNQGSLRIELVSETQETQGTLAGGDVAKVESERHTETGSRDVSQTSSESCMFVASRNSKLYHSATCAVVKRIKPANKLCFRSSNEAVARGLKPGCVE